MESYLSYLHKTLGLEHVILPPKGTDTLLAHQNSARYHFQCVSFKPLTLAEEDLFQKIIAALKLGDEAYSTAVGVDVHFSSITVVFSDVVDGRGVWHTHGASQVLHTHSLSSMLIHPQLKKECWAHLQTIKNH